MTELKPCPFCGSETEWWKQFGWDRELLGYVAGCCSCGIQTWICDTKEQAIETWNTRAERTCQRVNNPDQFFADNIEYSVDAYRCSVCNFRLDRITNYCPNCGAKVIDRVVEE